MELTNINKLLENLDSPSSEYLTFVSKEKGHQGVSDNSYRQNGVEGEYDEYSLVYKVIGFEELYLKITKQTDSYGDNDSIVGIQFVMPKEVKITVFDNIK